MVAVTLSETMILVKPNVTTHMPEGEPVIDTEPFEPVALMEEQPCNVGDPRLWPVTTASIDWPASAYKTIVSILSIVVHVRT